jgi:hypothetical protein
MSSFITPPEIPADKKVFYTYIFEIEFYNDNASVKPLSVMYVQKECDYRTNFNPVYLMTLQVTKPDLFILRRNQKDLMASVTVMINQYMILKAEESGAAETTSLVGSEILSSSVFEPIFSQGTFDERYREEVYDNKEAMVNDSETTVGRETGSVNIDVQFEDIIAVNSKKTLFNLVAGKGATVGTILQYIVDALPVKGAIVDMPDNDYALGETIIPPGNLVPALKYIQYNIGIYEYGLLAFHDDDILYILNKYALDHDCEEGDKIITHIYVTELDSILGGTVTRGLDPATEEPLYFGSIIAKSRENEVVSGELEGNNFIFSSFRQGLSAVQYEGGEAVSGSAKPVSMVMKRNIETYKHSREKNILDYDELGNPYNMASWFNELEATVKQVNVNLDNINVKDFKPNKFVRLHYLDQEKDMRLGGMYHINTITGVFTPVNPAATREMACKGAMTLSRRNPGIGS